MWLIKVKPSINFKWSFNIYSKFHFATQKDFGRLWAANKYCYRNFSDSFLSIHNIDNYWHLFSLRTNAFSEIAASHGVSNHWKPELLQIHWIWHCAVNSMRAGSAKILRTNPPNNENLLPSTAKCTSSRKRGSGRWTSCSSLTSSWWWRPGAGGSSQLCLFSQKPP